VQSSCELLCIFICRIFAYLPRNTLKNLRANIALQNPTAARSMASNSSPADLIDSTGMNKQVGKAS